MGMDTAVQKEMVLFMETAELTIEQHEMVKKMASDLNIVIEIAQKFWNAHCQTANGLDLHEWMQAEMTKRVKQEG